jgi:hypothetical protein
LLPPCQALLLVTVAAAVPMPKPMILSAPFTPFTNQNTINLTAVPALADHAAKFGVNTVWTVGGMGQFETLTMNGERSSRVSPRMIR